MPLLFLWYTQTTEWLIYNNEHKLKKQKKFIQKITAENWEWERKEEGKWIKKGVKKSCWEEITFVMQHQVSSEWKFTNSFIFYSYHAIVFEL